MVTRPSAGKSTARLIRMSGHLHFPGREPCHSVTMTNGTTITTNSTYDAMAQIQWKTNYPGANATNPGGGDWSSALGTWTVTFAAATKRHLQRSRNYHHELHAARGCGPATISARAPRSCNSDCSRMTVRMTGTTTTFHGTYSHVKFTGAAALDRRQFQWPHAHQRVPWRTTSANVYSISLRGSPGSSLVLAG